MTLSTALISMGILKVNFDRAQHDILDNFLPFVADRVFHMQDQVISIPDLREAIRNEYGLAIPAGALKAVIKRCAKRGLVRLEDGVLYPDPKKLQAYDISTLRQDVRRKHSALVQLGIRFLPRGLGRRCLRVTSMQG